jgi:hypothetical protein
MPFVKGQSGNPGGGFKATKGVVMQARQMSPLALRKLKAVLNDADAPHQAKIAASQVILDRAWGRPAQPHTGQHGEGPVSIVIHRGTAPAPNAGH